jgi:hypothetical protein
MRVESEVREVTFTSPFEARPADRPNGRLAKRMVFASLCYGLSGAIIGLYEHVSRSLLCSVYVLQTWGEMNLVGGCVWLRMEKSISDADHSCDT